MFRIVQETLTNISKYAKARHVEVSLREDGGMARVRVRDDGVGFDPERAVHSSHGLRGMRFRVEAERGLLTIASSPGAGSVIEAALPLEADEA
ncbi:sensor histidine kinase [Propionivibrio sp.]|uniref:sensor histidine kinase n=1 Tax=Propionivibrio sp. TaxID=2212460 RepID=UPI0039E4DA2E